MEERELYPLVQECLMTKFLSKFDNCLLEITSEGVFSEELKAGVQRGREIIFSFLKRGISPDVTGFIKTKYGKDFITVEIKNGRIKLQDIYQAKMYADLFLSKYAFLLSRYPIPYEIKNLNQTAVFSLLKVEYGNLRLATFSIHRKELESTGRLVCSILEHTWFPDNPFGKPLKPEDTI